MKEQFIQDLIENKQPFSYLASRWLIDRVPYIFDNEDQYIHWKERLARLIGVDSKSIVFVGSSCIGFSLSPHKKLDDFDKYSDIDIAIVSSHYFDVSWQTLINIGTKIFTLNYLERGLYYDHKKRLIYHGTIAADKIIHLLPFGKEWVESLSKMSQMKPTIGREIKVRIYKDFESLRAYHINNLIELKDIQSKKL